MKHEGRGCEGKKKSEKADFVVEDNLISRTTEQAPDSDSETINYFTRHNHHFNGMKKHEFLWTLVLLLRFAAFVYGIYNNIIFIKALIEHLV